MIGDAFGKLFDLIWSGLEWLAGGIADLFQKLIDFLTVPIEVFFALVQGLLYLLYMIGVLVAKFFQVAFEVAAVLWSLVQGFGRTLASLNYSPRSSGGHGYSEMIGKIFEKMAPLQIEPIAYISLFSLWFITAISAMKLISSIRVGGS